MYIRGTFPRGAVKASLNNYHRESESESESEKMANYLKNL